MTSDMILDSYEPLADWFAHNPFGIHGIRHVTRVLVWADDVAQWMIKEGKLVDIEVVRWAAVLHDVGRFDDGRDLDHGRRSAQWIAENHGRIFPAVSVPQLEMIQYCCEWHVPADDQAPEMTEELVCLKDADGLDRVRIMDLDPAQLRTAHSRRRTSDAQVLYVATRDGVASDPWTLVRQEATRRGWWR